MNFDIDAIAAELVDDGDTYVIVLDSEPDQAFADDGTWTFRLCIEHDDLQVSDIEDPEVFGRYECRQYLDGNRDRPDGFTGAAVKIPDDANQGYYYWYEPPKDLRRFKGSGFSTIEAWEEAKALNLSYVRNLLSWGYIQIGVKLTHLRPDGYTRKWAAWVGGVESGTGLWGESLKHHDEYVAEMVKDQIAEVIGEVEEEVSA